MSESRTAKSARRSRIVARSLTEHGHIAPSWGQMSERDRELNRAHAQAKLRKLWKHIEHVPARGAEAEIRRIITLNLNARIADEQELAQA